MRKLQISLPDFRRLCIFKGIYPREPRNKKKASKSSTPSTTFYYAKDIQYLLHEPLLAKFRDHKALSKKIAKLLGRGEVGDAARLERNGRTKTSLDHIVKERYPTFVDALRDLDDALSLLFLFANLPSTVAVPPRTIRLCQRLCHEFQLYVIKSHSLRKSFLSIKGIYYQATIQGQEITWLVPHKFVQNVTGDVDFRIMGTFVEFYTTLLGFVIFRLYSSIGLVYPPRFNNGEEDRGAELGAFSLENLSFGGIVDTPRKPDPTHKHIESSYKSGDAIMSNGTSHGVPEGSLQNENAQDDEGERELHADADSIIDQFEIAAPGADTLPQPEISSQEASTLFSSMHIFLSREAPRHPLEFILKSFGCKRVSWDPILGAGAFTSDEKDPSITHQVVDRPSMPFSDGLEIQSRESQSNHTSPATTNLNYRFPGRAYVQPQWIWDCINAGKLLRSDLYAPGAILPPHLSPWVKPKPGAYDPTLPLAEQESEGEKVDGVHIQSSPMPPPSETPMENSDAILPDIEDDERAGDIVTLRGRTDSEVETESEGPAGDDAFDGFEDEGDTAEESLYQTELEAEANGLQGTQDASDHKHQEHAKDRKVQQPRKRQKGYEIEKRRKDEEIDRRLGMTSRKKRKLYEKMMHGKQREDQEAASLRRKRRRLEQIAS